MTEQKNQTSQVSQNPVAKIGGGISGWFGALMGKPRSSTKVPRIPGQDLSESQKQIVAPAPRDDSVIQDVAAIKKVFSKVSSTVASRVAPLVKEGITETSKAASTITKKTGPKFITKILRIFFVLLLLIILGFVAVKLFNTKKGVQEESKNGGSIAEVSPTPVIYNPPKASIYATEESILKLEEDINVITREFGNAVLKENELTPPTLDFNVVFKD